MYYIYNMCIHILSKGTTGINNILRLRFNTFILVQYFEFGAVFSIYWTTGADFFVKYVKLQKPAIRNNRWITIKFVMLLEI